IVLICFTALIGQRANQLEELAKQANTSFEQNSLLLEAAENYQFASLMIRSDYLRQSGIDFYVLALREQDRTSELLNQALPLAEKLVRLDSNNALSYELLGKILLAQGKIDLAKDNFVKAVALSPFIPRNYINLSSVLVIQKDREQAKKVIERILSYYPDEITEIREMRIMPNQQILSGISEDIKMLKQLRAELDKAN
ncbi:MAG: hypothetical protein MUF50_04640, partial [Planctomycetes bacterium]|nr:hypothetical protein [Planctomycetota bacterium]